jgi:AP-1 complex subunit mu
MCGISAIYILDKKGRVLISRHFRSDLPSNIYDIFNKKILEYDEYTLKYPHTYYRPVIKDKENHLFYFHKHNDLNLVAISKKNNNAVMVFSFLHTLVNVLESYFKEAQE